MNNHKDTAPQGYVSEAKYAERLPKTSFPEQHLLKMFAFEGSGERLNETLSQQHLQEKTVLLLG